MNATRMLFNGARAQLFTKCVPTLANDESFISLSYLRSFFFQSTGDQTTRYNELCPG